jgi:hypothetical protein
METKQIVDSILETVRAEVSDFVETHEQITSSTEYEERLLEIGKLFALGLLTKSIGTLPKSRNSKKSLDQSRETKLKEGPHFVQRHKTLRH